MVLWLIMDKNMAYGTSPALILSDDAAVAQARTYPVCHLAETRPSHGGLLCMAAFLERTGLYEMISGMANGMTSKEPDYHVNLYRGPIFQNASRS